jgi:hypothetical protein
MEREYSLQCTQEPATETYSGSAESNSHLHIRFTICFLVYAVVSKMATSFHVFRLKFCAHFSAFVSAIHTAHLILLSKLVQEVRLLTCILEVSGSNLGRYVDYLDWSSVVSFIPSRGPPLWSSGQSFWLQIQRYGVPFTALPDFLRSSGSGTGSTQPREDNWRATWKK